MGEKLKPTIITLTPAAVVRVKEIMANSNNKVIGLRISIKNGGCAGMSYDLNYAKEQIAGDELVIIDNINIFIDPAAILFLLGTEMDYKIETMSSGFVFNNPNQTSACGCGESVSISPVNKEVMESFAKEVK